MSERDERLLVLATEVLRISRNSIILNLRFLDGALSRLSWRKSDEIRFATDGESLIFNPAHVLARFLKGQEYVTRDYIHALLHCVFRHMFVHTLVDHEYWDLACDIAVEYSISQLGIDALRSPRAEEQETVFHDLQENGIVLTAEKLYRCLLDQEYDREELDYFHDLFLADDHNVWYEPDNEQNAGQGNSQDESGQSRQERNEQQTDSGDGDGGEQGEAQPAAEQNAGNGSGGAEESDEDAEKIFCEQDWRDLSRRMQTELETFARTRGTQAGGLVQNLRSVNREKYDYAAFLKKFAVLGERMQLNEDEFDYIYYTYGMELYGEMPLIEPLEYKEVKLVREFVIAIDTSGSTAGEKVEHFLTKTYNILKTTESFFSRVNLHIIQCDAEVQEDVRITKQEEFDDYLAHLQIRGQGGTDFRPVFRYVDTLRAQKAFFNLRGLIYFTDGHGIYPEQKPDYETAFVFLEDGYDEPEVPAWAIRLVLPEEEL